MKSIIRARRLTFDEAAKYKAIREQIEQEVPDLIARHHARQAFRDQPHQFRIESDKGKQPG